MLRVKSECSDWVRGAGQVLIAREVISPPCMEVDHHPSSWQFLLIQISPKCALHFSSQSLAITTFSSHEIAQSWRCIHLSFILGGGEIGFGCQLKYGLTQFKEVLNSFSTGHSPSYFLQMPLKKITITLLQIFCAIECSSRWYQIRNRYVWCILMSLPR